MDKGGCENDCMLLVGLRVESDARESCSALASRRRQPRAASNSTTAGRILLPKVLAQGLSAESSICSGVIRSSWLSWSWKCLNPLASRVAAAATVLGSMPRMALDSCAPLAWRWTLTPNRRRCGASSPTQVCVPTTQRERFVGLHSLGRLASRPNVLMPCQGFLASAWRPVPDQQPELQYAVHNN